jgi:hypothetical protein
VAVNLGAELQGLAGGVRPVRAGVQHGAAVAQARHPLAVEQVGVDTGSLRGGVCAQAQHAPTQLVHELESLELQFAAGTRQQGIQMLKQRRDHQLKPTPGSLVDQAPAQRLHLQGLSGQYVCNVFRQQPGSGHETTQAQSL